MDFEHVKANKKPNEMVVPIALDPEWADRLASAHATLAQAEITLSTAEKILESLPEMAGEHELQLQQAEVDDARAKVDDARAAHDALLEAADDKIVRFRFRALSANELDALREKYPPTPEQKDEARRNKAPAPIWNFELYQPALVHAALVEPAWSLEQITEIWNDENWNIAELRALYGAADALCTTRQVVDLGED